MRQDRRSPSLKERLTLPLLTLTNDLHTLILRKKMTTSKWKEITCLDVLPRGATPNRSPESSKHTARKTMKQLLFPSLVGDVG